MARKKTGKTLGDSELTNAMIHARDMEELVAQLQALVNESGNPEGFDAHAWLAQWVNQPCPALGGKKPVNLLGTQEGKEILSSLISKFQTGAYG